MESAALLSERNLSSKKTESLPKYEDSMICYKSSCQEDPELQSFDSALHQRTDKLVNSLVSQGGRTGNADLSLDSLIQVCGFLTEVGQDVANIIVDCKDVMWKNKELKSLVDLYCVSTNKTLKLFNTVEQCVDNAESINLLIRVAIKQFETESMDTDIERNKKNKYAETLEMLNKVKAMEYPFGDEFATQYEEVHEEQVMLLDEVLKLQGIFEKKHKNAKKSRRLGNMLFAASFFSAIALSIVSALTVVAIPVAATVAIGFTAATTVATKGIQVNCMRKDYEKALIAQTEFLELTTDKTIVNIESMKTIKSLVETLIMRISSIMKTAEVAVVQREEETVKLVMKQIVRKVEGFADKIEEVGATVAKCSKSVVSGRTVVLEHIANSP